MPAFLLAIFLSAFLLFQVQPIIARYILPWFGGSPAVWTTCMLFFQVGLLAGYTYAHLLVQAFRSRPQWQVGIHLGLLLVSLLLLPITPDEALKPENSDSPVGGIVTLLLVTVGLPYVIISASGPLLQHWFGSAIPGKSPYRLYAVSNLGSLLGLVSYPFLFEPRLKLGEQTQFWSLGYVGYGILAFLCGWLFLRKSVGSRVEAGEAESAQRSPWSHVLLWIAFPATASILLLATTSQMSQDVAVVPLLWILPLGLYLVTFIISFDHSRWYDRRFWIPFAVVAIGVMIYLLGLDDHESDWEKIGTQVAIYVAAMFGACMVCHGEMVRLKPPPSRLTGFYLAISLGGALGGAFVTLVAPCIFDGYWELHAGLALLAVLVSTRLWGACLGMNRKFSAGFVSGALTVLWMSALSAMAVFLTLHVRSYREGALVTKRGFYGVLRVMPYYDEDDDNRHLSLLHGRINHGTQYKNYPRWAGSYYADGSGPATFFDFHPSRAVPEGENSQPMHFGVVGLGIGTLSAYAEAGDRVRMYEINEQVEELARSNFTYLEDCEGEETVVLGDARIMLEQELARGEAQQFDGLFLDAFSGDAIPLHLLTAEAFELYFKHLKPDGVLLVHVTNRHLDLSDPVRVLAEQFNRQALLIDCWPDDETTQFSSWILIGARDNELLTTIELSESHTPWDREEPKPIRWTDDYGNVLQVLWEDESDAE